jgi:peptidyl-tRNA hydrolase, PTH1 family
MRLIVGLGNPGKNYEKNRHNTGFMMVDQLAEKNGLKWRTNGKCKALTAGSPDFLLVKPQTFMNLSGESVSCLLNYYKVKGEDLLVIHDDVDLALGKVKKQFGGGSAGHKGIENIILRLGTPEFWRIRVGVGRPEEKDFEIEDWVLSDFSPEEMGIVREIEPDL